MMTHSTDPTPFGSLITSFGADTLPARYASFCERYFATPDPAFEQYRKAVEERDAAPDSGSPSPRLSVIMRTQGKRTELLREALLSLSAQKNDDFEILLILHRAEDSAAAETEELVRSLPASLSSRIRLERLNEGQRAAPLNYAVSLSRGTYFAILDDDDLVFPSWTDDFIRGAEEHPGQVIRCYGLTQKWEINGKSGAPRSLSKPEATYCEPFSIKTQLNENRTPISCAAFPAFLFREYGICFDETLTTTEDWDYLMRTGPVVGVYDTCGVNFLYRLWQKAESSKTLHPYAEWESNRLYVKEKLKKIPLLVSFEDLEKETVAEKKKVSFSQRLKKAIKKYGILGLPLAVIRKIWYKLFCRH